MLTHIPSANLLCARYSPCHVVPLGKRLLATHLRKTPAHLACGVNASLLPTVASDLERSFSQWCPECPSENSVAALSILSEGRMWACGHGRESSPSSAHMITTIKSGNRKEPFPPQLPNSLRCRSLSLSPELSFLLCPCQPLGDPSLQSPQIRGFGSLMGFALFASCSCFHSGTSGSHV